MTTRPDLEGDRRRALELAGFAASRRAEAQSQEASAIRFAADAGASPDDIAEVTELDAEAVRKIIDR